MLAAQSFASTIDPNVRLAEIEAAVRQEWNEQFRRRRSSGSSVDAGPFIVERNKAIAVAGGLGASAARALQTVYGTPDPGQPGALPSTAVLALLTIEIRLGRAHSRLVANGAVEDREEHHACLQRQAALISFLDPSQRQRPFDDLLEAVLEDRVTAVRGDVQGPGEHVWNDIAAGLDKLSDMPSEAELPCELSAVTHRRGLLDPTNRTILAIEVSPPSLLRSEPPRSELSLAHAAALAAPMRARRLLNILGGGVVGPKLDSEAVAEIADARRRLALAAEGWVSRSRPMVESPGDRGFTDWANHSRRCLMIGFHEWAQIDFRGDFMRAMRLGRALTDNPSAHGTTLSRYAVMCLSAHEARAQPPVSEPIGWYLDEAKRVVSLLGPRSDAAIKARLLSTEEAPVYGLAPAMADYLRGEPCAADADVDWLKQSLAEIVADDDSDLLRWLAQRAIARTSGGPEPAPPRLPEGVSEALATELLLSWHRRPIWIAGLGEALDEHQPTKLDAFIEDLDRAVQQLGRADSILGMTLARRYMRTGRWSDAINRAERVMAVDPFPRTVAHAKMLISEVYQAERPFDGLSAVRAYDMMWDSWNATVHTGLPVSGAPLVKAAVLANALGWVGEAALCLAQVRKFEGTSAAMLRRPVELRNFRLRGFANWALRRRASPRSRKLREELLTEAVGVLAMLQSGTVRDNRTLVATRATVAKLAAATPGNEILPELIRKTHNVRLHALAVTLHRVERRSIDDRVLRASIDRLRDTHLSATLIGAWIVGRYFDDNNFEQTLQKVLLEIDSYAYGRAALGLLKRELPNLLAEEVASRCADKVRSRIGGLGIQRLWLEDLAARRLSILRVPRGYRRGGHLLIGEDVLSRLVSSQTTRMSCAVGDGIWVEALFATRVLSMLQDTLSLEHPVKLSEHVKAMTLTMNLSSDAGRPMLQVTGRIERKQSADRGAWCEAVGLWANAASETVKTNLTSKWSAMPKPVFEWSIGESMTDFKISLALWSHRPAGTRQEHQVSSLLDRHFALLWGRLHGRDPSTIPSNPVSAMHLGKTALERLSFDPAAAGRVGVARAVKAVVQLAAKECWVTIRSPVADHDADLAEHIQAACRAQDLELALPAALNDMRVAMPGLLLARVLNTLLGNAAKASAVNGEAIELGTISSDDSVTVFIDSPYLEEALYPKGMGLGFMSVQTYAEFYGGQLIQGRRDGTDRWRVTLQLPRHAQPEAVDFKDAADLPSEEPLE
jgi:hypothetical protein